MRTGAREQAVPALTLSSRHSSTFSVIGDCVASRSVLTGTAASWSVPRRRTALWQLPQELQPPSTHVPWECAQGPETGLLDALLKLSFPNCEYPSVVLIAPKPQPIVMVKLEFLSRVGASDVCQLRAGKMINRAKRGAGEKEDKCAEGGSLQSLFTGMPDREIGLLYKHNQLLPL